MAVYNHPNQWDWTPTLTPTTWAPSGTHPVQSQTATSAPYSYAETTWLHVDEIARKTLRPYGENTIKNWVGRSLQKVVRGKQDRITVRDAKIINSKVGAPVFKITAENVVEFTIDPIIRDRLKPFAVNLIKPLLEELGVSSLEFQNLTKENITRSVTKEHAEKYNKYIQEHKFWNHPSDTNVFDLERIFNLADNESIVVKTTDRSTETVFIKFEPKHRKQLKALSSKSKQQITGIMGRNFECLLSKKQTISIKDAVLIHRISGEEIFDLSEKGMLKFAIHQDLKTELEYFLLQGEKIDEEIRAKIRNITGGKTKSLQLREAKELNPYLVKNQFDFQSILASAVRETEKEVKGLPDLPTPSNGTKRPLSASTVSQEEPAVLPSKRQRTADVHEQGTTPGVNGFRLFNQVPSLLHQSPFSLAVPPVQAIDAQVALPQGFGSPLDSENSLNEQSSSSPAFSSQDFESPFDFRDDEELTLNPPSPANPLSYAALHWED